MQSKAPDVGEVPLHELLAEVLAGDPTDGGFEVQYQPIVRLAGGPTVAVEAVACWQHPRVGQFAPAQFIAAAERAGLSAMRLTRPDLYAVIAWALGRYKLEASRLVIEIAHANEIEDAGVASKAIQRIRDRGVRVAIDDFGSGYDIMAQLQGLPVDLIKLDARITGAGVDATRTEAMCPAVLDMCERIGLTVITQGVATTEQVAALKGMGCKIGQGDLYGPALRLQRVGKAGKAKIAR